MTFLGLLLKNLIRQPVRTGLTLLGISLGITTVVALGVITGGLKASVGEMITLGDTDFMIAQKGAADLTLSTVAEGEFATIAARPDVDRAIGTLLHVTQVGDNPFFMMVGVQSSRPGMGLPDLRSGRYPAAGSADEIIVGESGAAALRVGVGGTYSFDGKPFRVVGIYHSEDTWQDSGAFAALSTVQSLAKKPGLLTAIYVGVRPGHDRAAVAASIVAAAPQLTAISEVSQLGEVDQGVELIDAANLAISVLAVVIGAIGVMNTMVMSVFERTREIGILRAIGWRGSRILRLIIGESLVLCVAAAAIGVGLGVLAVWAVQQLPAVENLLEPRYSGDVFVRALAVAVGVALVGAAYPLFRAVRLTPMEALRHE